MPPPIEKPTAYTRFVSMHATFSTSATSAFANATSSTLATQHGPTFHAPPDGPDLPFGYAEITPSASVSDLYGDEPSSDEPEPPSGWKSTTSGVALVPSYFDGTCRM